MKLTLLIELDMKKPLSFLKNQLCCQICLMNRKQTLPPLKLKRPDNYVIEYPDEYIPPKPKPEKPKKIEKPKIQKPPKPEISRIPRIPRPPIQKPIDEKRKYFLPGQKYPTPQEDDGLRIFYESLLAEKPESEIALRYCLEHGLLERDIAEKIVEHEKLHKVKRLSTQ